MFTSWRKGRTHYPPCQQRAREIAVYWRTQASKQQARGPPHPPWGLTDLLTPFLGFLRRGLRLIMQLRLT